MLFYWSMVSYRGEISPVDLRLHGIPESACPAVSNHCHVARAVSAVGAFG